MSGRQSHWAAIFWKMLWFMGVSIGLVWLAHKILDRVWDAYGGDDWLQRVVDVPVIERISRVAADHPRIASAAPYVVVSAVVAMLYYAYLRRRVRTARDDETKEMRLARELRQERERERSKRDVQDLKTLLESGRLALAKLEREPERPKPSGSIGLATPVLPVRYRGFEMDEWSGYVIQKLKTMEPAELERYFAECVQTRKPVERGRCYLDHLEKIISRLR